MAMTQHIFTTLGKKTDAFVRILRDQRAVTSIEYGLLAALIAVAAIQAMSSLGGTLSNTFTAVDTAMVGDGGGGEGPVTPIPDMP